MLEVVPVLATSMIPGTGFIDKFIKPINPERRSGVPEICRSAPILARFTDIMKAQINLARTEKEEEGAICEVRK